eukprot:8236223-Pyramimonas_sp.AAC.1
MASSDFPLALRVSPSCISASKPSRGLEELGALPALASFIGLAWPMGSFGKEKDGSPTSLVWLAMAFSSRASCWCTD